MMKQKYVHKGKDTMHLITYFLYGVLSFVLIISVPVALAEEMLNIVPQDDDISGWLRDGETAIATDLDSLTGLINGAAPFYLERGAVEVIFQDYAKDDVYLTLEIYRMDQQANAKRLYTEIEAEEPEELERIGTEGRLVSGLIGTYLVEYWQKTFFLRLTITEKSQQSKETILNFAKLVSEKMNMLE